MLTFSQRFWRVDPGEAHESGVSVLQLQGEVIPYLADAFGQVHRVEMNAGGATFEQVIAELSHDIDTELPHAISVVAKIFQPVAKPQGDLCAALAAETLEIVEVGDRHHARHNRNVDALRLAVIDKTKVSIHVVKILSDGSIKAQEIANEVLIDIKKIIGINFKD